jgi:VIT1/CCC1 family predicted Fe2+/Mn2+ transporter
LDEERHQGEANMDRRRRPESASDRPSVEPEIITPDDVRSREAEASMSFDGRPRIYVARIGPFGFAIMAVAIAILAALFFLLALSAFVVLLPLAGLLLAIIIAVGLFRILIWRS